MRELQYTKTKGDAGDPKDKVADPSQVINLVLKEARKRGLSWFNKNDAAAMVGSFIQESGGFRRDVIELSLRGDDGTAYGLMQWRGDRYKNLLNFAQSKNMNPKSILTQISFAFEEGSKGSKFQDFGSVKAFKQMSQSRSLQDKATAFIHAERPAGYGNGKGEASLFAHDRSKRIAHAEKALGLQPSSSDYVETASLNNRLGASNYDDQNKVNKFDMENPNDFLGRYKQIQENRTEENKRFKLSFENNDTYDSKDLDVNSKFGLQNRFSV